MKATTILLIALLSGVVQAASTGMEATTDSSVAATAPPPPPTYMQLVTQRIRAEYRYPKKAQYDDEEGSVVVKVRIARDGTILNKDLATPCKWELLNAEALDIFNRIGRLPPVPDSIYPEITTFEFKFPINFQLK